jgi:hypothetical protein
MSIHRGLRMEIDWDSGERAMKQVRERDEEAVKGVCAEYGCSFIGSNYQALPGFDVQYTLEWLGEQFHVTGYANLSAHEPEEFKAEIRRQIEKKLKQKQG